MPTLGELLNKGNKKLIHVPEGFELKEPYGDNILEPNGLVTLSVFHKKRNGDLGHKCFSNICISWNAVINEITKCLHTTRQIEFHMRLSFKMSCRSIDEEMFHGTITQQVLDELIEISKKYFKEDK